MKTTFQISEANDEQTVYPISERLNVLSGTSKMNTVPMRVINILIDFLILKLAYMLKRDISYHQSKFYRNPPSR